MHTNTTGGPTDRPVRHRRPEDAADQPTTEPSPIERVIDLFEGNFSRWYARTLAEDLAEAGLLAPAPQPAADTKTEVQCAMEAMRDAERDGRLRGIQERTRAATEGPWETYQVPATRKHAAFMAVEVGDIEVKVARFEGGFFDAAFIAAARTDVPWLLAEVARQAAVIQKVRDLADRWEHGALRWANPLPVPPEVGQIRRALDGAEQ